MALALRRGFGSLALRSFAACLRRHVPPPPPLETLAPVALTPTRRRPLAPPCRHFAAPPQVNKKAKEDDDDGPRLNDAIRAPVVRLVTDEGHKVVSRHEALQLAARMDMDLVEVDKKSDPPVCKIMDFHKEKYNKDVKQKERLKSKSAIVLRGGENKEVRFKGKTELKDLMVKADAITRLMERGYRVKCMAMPSGNEGEDLGAPLSRLLGLIQDVCIVESGPHLDSKHAYVIVRHVKFATKKGGKKASKAIEDAGKGTHVTASESPIESDSEADDKAISAQKGGKDQGFKRELNQSTANPGADREKLQSINSGGSRTRPGQWGPQTPELRHDFKDARSDMNKGENYNQIKEHGENNRYAARRQPVREGNPSFSQGRYPQDRRRDGNEGRYAMHGNQRPLEQHNQPLPRFNQGRVPQDLRNETRGPSPLNKGQRPLEQHNQPLPRFNQGRVAQDPRNENRGHIPLNNDQRQQPDGDSGGPNPTTKSFGIFSTPKPEPRKTNDAPASTPANTDSPKSYGIFSSKR